MYWSTSHGLTPSFSQNCHFDHKVFLPLQSSITKKTIPINILSYMFCFTPLHASNAVARDYPYAFHP